VTKKHSPKHQTSFTVKKRTIKINHCTGSGNQIVRCLSYKS
jgi:hypothetical protein